MRFQLLTHPDDVPVPAATCRQDLHHLRRTAIRFAFPAGSVLAQSSPRGTAFRRDVRQL